MKRTFGIFSLALAMTVAAFGQAQATQQSKTEMLGQQELLTLVSTAKTPAQHERIAQYYQAQARGYLAESKEHAQMAEEYKKNPMTNNSKAAFGTVNHCEYLAQSCKEKATKMQELAQLHEQMAKDAEQR